MKKILLLSLILAAAAACNSPGTSGGVDVPDKSDSSSDTAAADTSTPSDGSVADVVVPTTCPSEANGFLKLVGCDAVGQLCTLGTACGVCQFVEGCAYYSDGPKWGYARPVNNTGRAECPDEMPDVGASCDVDFSSSGFAPCQYCKQSSPAPVACLEGVWLPTPSNYCL